MTGFRLRTFGGKAPKIFARLLPEDMAQVATNVRLDSGRLEPWKGNATATITPVNSYSISGSTKTLLSLTTQYGLEETKTRILFAHRYLKTPMNGYMFLVLVGVLVILG